MPSSLVRHVAAGAALVTRWDRVGIGVAVGGPAAIVALERDPRVRLVENDIPLALYADRSHVATRADEARRTRRLFDAAARSPFDGSGVTIAVVDSGIDATHEMFIDGDDDKVVRNLRTACTDAVRCDEMIEVEGFNDPDGHGTHLAGIAAGFPRTTSKGWNVRGVATGARIVSIGGDAYTGSGFGMLNGLNWVLENHADPCRDGSCPPIRVVTNSWGSAYLPCGPSPVAEAGLALTDELVDAGVVVVYAFGNEGGDGSANCGSALAQNPTPGVIGVTNYDDRQSGDRDHDVDASSSRGLVSDPTTYPDIAAPGSYITSACTAPGWRCSPLYLWDTTGDLRYATLGGTSPAAPYIAGVVALLVQADPSLTPAEVEDVIEDTAHQFGPGDYFPDPANDDHTTSFDRGHGLVDVTAALAEVLDRQPPRWRCGTARISDRVGDATSDLTWSNLSEPQADITNAWIATDEEQQVLRFTVAVTDLAPTAPPGSNGLSVSFDFGYRGESYRVVMSRVTLPEVFLGDQHVGGDDIRFRLQHGVGVFGRTIVADGLVGSFDDEGDLITADVPLDAIARWNPDMPPFAPGDELTDLQVGAFPLLTPYPADESPLGRADGASGACPYVIGN